MDRSRARFFALRLRHTSLPELVHRLGEFLAVRRVTRLAGQPSGSPGKTAAGRLEAKGLLLPALRSTVTKETLSACLAGKTFGLNGPDEEVRRFEEAWRGRVFRDVPQTGSLDIRSVWEPARLQNIMVLLAHLSSGSAAGDARDIDRQAKGLVLKWIADNPFPFGPHYMSAMECGLRIMVFSYCLMWLQTLSDGERASIAASLFDHAWLVSRRLSLHSSLGNHTIAESVGLVLAGGFFKTTGEGRKWLETGVRLLEKELHHQVLADGGPGEQSFSYLRFVLDLYRLAADFLEDNRIHDCSAWRPALLRGEDFLASFNGGGVLPAVGDSDDGHAIAPGVSPARPEVASGREKVRSFPMSGYTILRTSANASLFFLHSRLGMSPFYNHGHADALSVILNKEGEEILIDPGTYRYNGSPEWRRYFKGTRAHNTVTLDGLDQAVQETSFIWSKPYKTVLLRAEESDGLFVLEATNDGYARLAHPVHHTRLVCLLNGEDFAIRDVFSGGGTHRFELTFHLHPHAVVREEGEWIGIRKGHSEIGIALVGPGTLNVIKGSESPPFGWYSPGYGLKMASPVLTHAEEGEPAAVTFLTIISTGKIRPDIEKTKEIAWHL